MTTSGICEQFGFVRPRSRKHGSVSIASGWKMACALFVLCAATAVVSPAQTFRTLVTLNGADCCPGGPLVQGLDGNFYGTESFEVFKVTRSGVLTTLHSCPLCPDGWGYSGLTLGTDGNFYGTTTYGGGVFKVTPDGTLTTLYYFCPAGGLNCPDGEYPQGLIQASDGNFYGTTLAGGYNRYRCGGSSGAECGTVFKITPSGVLTTLHNFCSRTNCADGFSPNGLVQGTDGNFYGTTGGGGDTQCNPPYGCGTLFRITPTGTLTTLRSFNATNGRGPHSLVQGIDGNIYGATGSGGTSTDCPSGCGTFFKITPNGTLTTLLNFDGADSSGSGVLVQATDGNFYGIGSISENCPFPEGCGTVFKMTPSGTVTTLHTFAARFATPLWLVQATNGTFYGETLGGGAHGYATVFSLCVGLGWFVETLPTTGTVGATIQILGTDFTGATAVTFNGTPAPFTIISRTQIQTTVPSGATTGSVKVTIPSGTPTSNKRFRVLPQMTSFSPTSGPAGTVVTITGVSLAQTTRIGIGGVSASFTVVDDTTVTATVPTGATTGKKVVITTRGGNVASATTFTVTE